MAERKTIGGTFNVTVIDEVESLEVQYAPSASPTAAQIHTTFEEGDKYMRTRLSGDEAWGGWVKIVGEDGRETDYSFNTSKAKTSAGGSTPPTQCRYTEWQDAPVAVTDDFPFLWTRIQRKDRDGKVTSTSYARLTGEDGKPGTNGGNTATVYLYKRSASAVASVGFTQTLTYTFATHKLSSTPNGWSQTIPSGDAPLYVTAATAYSTEAADTIAYTEWASPVKMAENGENGEDAVSCATVWLYQRSASKPSKPSGSMEYRFSDGVLLGIGNDAWQRTMPEGVQPCWLTQATALGAGATDEIEPSEWSEPAKMAENGKDGESITKKSETYRYATNKTGVRPVATSSDWMTGKPATLLKGYWLYTETTITWSDGSKTVLYTDERNPNDGAAGQDIVVDGATEMKYCVTSSGTSHPAETSTEWKELSAVTQEQGKWLWTKATTYYRKASSASGARDAGKSVNYSVGYIAKDGAAGRGITGVTEYYKATASSAEMAVQTSDSGWSADPNLADLSQKWGKTYRYLWNYEKTTYSSGTAVERTKPQCIAIWTEDGAEGAGIDSIVNYYAISASGTDAPTGGWDDDPTAPTAAEPFLWNYEVVTLTNGKTQQTEPHVVGHYGKDGGVLEGIVLVASPAAVSFKKNTSGNGYTPSSMVVKCGYVLTAEGGTESVESAVSVDVNGTTYRIYRRRMTGTSGTVWQANTTAGLTISSSDGYTAVEFVLSSATVAGSVSAENIISRVSVPIVKGGLDGVDAASYWLQTTPDVVSVSVLANGGVSPTSYDVECRVVKSEGEEVSVYVREGAMAFSRNGWTPESWDYDLYYRRESDSGWQAYTGAVSVATGNNRWVEFVLANASGASGVTDANTIARKAVAIVKGGQPGAQGPQGPAGAQGAEGRMGRSFYYGGEWSAHSSSETFTVTDTQAPFFKVGSSYYVWKGGNGTYYFNSSNTPGNGSSNWELMYSDFNYLISKAVFTDFAQLGSGVFNGDWMFSQYGGGRREVWSGTWGFTNLTSYRQVGHSVSNSFSTSGNHFAVKKGVVYTVWIEASGSGSGGQLQVAFNLSGSSVTTSQIRAPFTGTLKAEYAITFVAPDDCEAFVMAYGSGTVYGIYVDYDEGFERFSPSFAGGDPVELFKGSVAASSSMRWLGYGTFFAVAGKRYKVSVTASSGNGSVRLVQGRTSTYASSDSMNISSGTYDGTFTIDGSYSGYVSVYMASGSATVTRVVVEAVEPFKPKVAVDWLSGYAQFGGGAVAFNADGSGRLAGGNIHWTREGDFYGRTGFFSGFTRRLPTIVSPGNGGRNWGLAEDLYDHKTSSSSITRSTSVSARWVMPDLAKCGAWIVLTEHDGSFDTSSPDGYPRVHLPFLQVRYVADANGNSVDKSFAGALQVTAGGRYSGKLAWSEAVKAMSYQGCRVEITNLTNTNVLIRGLRGRKYSNEYDEVHDPWDMFMLYANATVVAECSFYGKDYSTQTAGLDIFDRGMTAAIAWDIVAYEQGVSTYREVLVEAVRELGEYI